MKSPAEIEFYDHGNQLLIRMDLVGKSGQRFIGKLKPEKAMRMLLFFQQNETDVAVLEDYQI